jgi:glyoxylase-like metal-dependent hydrolase (beta-lactamase superfamily II)
MKVTSLRSNESIYTCNAYLVLGTWKAIQDINTLIDIGTDGSIIDEIELVNTGVGKKPVEQIIFTHCHFDQTGGLKQLKDKYNPKVYAFTYFEGVDELLNDGQTMKIGDREFEVIHLPGHSSDSICLYCKEDEILFSGDAPLRIMTAGGSYSADFIDGLENLMRHPIRTIYPGHDGPIREKATDIVRTTLRNVKNSATVGYT